MSVGRTGGGKGRRLACHREEEEGEEATFSSVMMLIAYLQMEKQSDFLDLRKN